MNRKLLISVVLLVVIATTYAANLTLSNTYPEDTDSPNRLQQKIAASVAKSAASPDIATGQVALNSSTSTQIVAALTTRHSVLIRNLDASVNVYVGKSGVTTATGMLLKPGDSIVVNSGVLIHAISASATPTVAFLSENE